ncbi:MAG: hypothetical protein WC765_00495 [Phycisphaerae bacterium]|jgi:hypothetical protein
MKSQGILFSEPSCAETAVWCELSDGIDPAKWARLCREIGKLNTSEFENISNVFMSQIKHISGVKENIPLVSIGPSCLTGEYQWKIG